MQKRPSAGGKGAAMKQKKLKRAAVLLLAGAALLCCAAAESRYRLTVTRYELSFETLPAEFDGLRIVHLSDLHGMSFGRDNRRLAAAVRALEPDIIALTGDFAGSADELPAAEALLRELSGTGEIYWVNGNHEWTHSPTAPEMEALVESFGGVSLDDGFVTLRRGEAEIVVAGSDDPNTWHGHTAPEELAQRLRAQYPETFTLWLGHRNFWVRDYPGLPVDLVLSGHGHGGVIRLPGIGGLLDAGRSLGAKYDAGLYRGGSFIMEVSRGLGSSAAVPRLFNPPEIVLLTLRAA